MDQGLQTALTYGESLSIILSRASVKKNNKNARKLNNNNIYELTKTNLTYVL